MTNFVVWQKVEVSGVNSPILWGNVWLFVLWVPNIFRQKAQNASDVWTQYVQWEHVLAKYQLVSAICCHEHMSARLAGRGEKICRIPGPEGTDPSRVPDNQSKHHHWAAPTLCSDWSRGSEMTMNESHLTHEIRRSGGMFVKRFVYLNRNWSWNKPHTQRCNSSHSGPRWARPGSTTDPLCL